MKILHVIRDLSRASGGPANALIGLSEAQAALGHSVSILTTNRGMFRMTPQNVETRDVPAYGGSWSWAPQFSSELAKMMSSGVDIVHGHMVWDYPIWAAARQARRKGIPFVLRPCGQLDRWSLSQRAIKKRVYLGAMGSFLRTASAIHFTTESERKNSQAVIGPRPSVVIPLGIPNAYRELPPPNAFATRFPALQGKRVILYLGRLHSKKQPEVAIDAFSRVASLDGRLHLVLAGPSEPHYEAGLVARAAGLGIANRVTLTGLLQGDAVREAYSAAEMFLLPSFQENFGIAIVEAMASLCPVIISEGIDLADEVVAAQAGIACTPNASSMASAIQRLALDDALRRSMGANGHELVFRRFTWPSIAEATIGAYQQIIDAPMLPT